MKTENRNIEKLPALDIALVTHGDDGAGRVAKMLLKPVNGVRYIVSWQKHGNREIPRELMRDDVEVHRTDSVGISANRNNAFDHCNAEVVWLADNDLVLSEEGLLTIRESFALRPEMHLAVFKVKYPYVKSYPPGECRLKIPFPKNFYVATFEMAIRRSALGDLRMHPMMGVGLEEFSSGEDEWYLISAIRSGADCRFIDRLICEHPAYTTGSSPEKIYPGVLRSSGFIIREMYPLSWPLRLVLKAWRTGRMKKGALFHLLRGALSRRRLRSQN